jgi:geranylgeranyl diphosphate synthase type I
MNLDEWTALVQPQIESELRAAVDQHISPRTPELRQMLAYHMGWEGEGSGPAAQGKRIRPLIVLLCAGASGASGGSWDCALPAAAAVELIHNFSLIHDDIQDQSPLRRGRPTVWVKWGIAQAINAGDTMFTLAFTALTRLQETATPALALQAHGLLEQVCLDLTHGQYLDISYEKRTDLTVDDYWPMVEGKTAALLAGCAELGGLSGGADPRAQAEFRRFGRCLGLAFQALDDWLGLWGDAALTGKSTDSDLVAGKKTLPILYGLGRNGPFARRWNAGPIPPEEAPSVARMLAEEGAREYTQQAADDLNRQALQALDAAAAPGDLKDALVELSARLLQRRS